MDMELDTNVVCSKCGKKMEINFTDCLMNGWPKCCGYTMEMKRTKADINQSVKTLIRGSIERWNTTAEKELSDFKSRVSSV